MTAAFLGGGYLTAFAIQACVIRWRTWSRVWIAYPGMVAFTTLTTLATLLHLDRFHLTGAAAFAVLTAWAWLLNLSEHGGPGAAAKVPRDRRPVATAVTSLPLPLSGSSTVRSPETTVRASCRGRAEPCRCPTTGPATKWSSRSTRSPTARARWP